MRYLKIKAANYREAMMELKKEHGSDAIPISHKMVKEGGFFNSKFFAKDVVELTAAVQEKSIIPKTIQKEKRRVDYTIGSDNKVFSERNSELPGEIAGGNNNLDMDSLTRSIDNINKNLRGIKADSVQNKDCVENKLTEEINSYSTKRDTVSSEKEYLESNSRINYEKEFNEIKVTLNKLIGDKNNSSITTDSSFSGEDALLKPYDKILKDNDYDIDQRHLIINEVKNSISREDLKDKFKIEKSLKDLLKSRIVTTGPIKLSNKKKIFMFVGPTGVGKTTTMAKLGALHSLREGHKVVFITIDNYRIAATEQLKKYAEIMRIPVYAVNDQKEFKSVIDKEKAEIIMVDTSGRSHNNELKIAEIKSFADQVEYEFEKILCVSANTKKNDVNNVFKAFDILNFNSVVITKVDETSFIGNVVDVADKYKKPIAYFTNGQEVPNDIEVAESGKIVDMMVGNINN